MTIQLKPEQERIIQEEIRSGHFRSPDEVLDHALTALREKEQKGSAPARPRKNLVELFAESPLAGPISILSGTGTLAVTSSYERLPIGYQRPL